MGKRRPSIDHDGKPVYQKKVLRNASSPKCSIEEIAYDELWRRAHQNSNLTLQYITTMQSDKDTQERTLN